MLAIRQTGRPSIPSIGFDQDSMEDLGIYAIAVELNRLAAGVNIEDRPASPLSPAYSRRKQKLGLDPIRNDRLSGNMLAARDVVQASHGSATVGFTSQEQITKATFNERREKMLGLSAANKEKVDEAIRQEFARKVHDAQRLLR